MNVPVAQFADRGPVYLGYCGPIDDAGATRIASAVNKMHNDRHSHIHLALSSSGGGIAAGVYLYNHLRALPVPITAYNTGSISSIAVVVFVAAEHRLCSPNSTFMIHPSSYPSLSGMNWGMLRTTAEAALAEEERIERILRQRARLPDQLLEARRSADVHISPQDAQTHGLVQGIAEFQVPAGSQVFQI
jgi:ATP-dependent Clp protease, protease subunit